MRGSVASLDRVGTVTAESARFPWIVYWAVLAFTLVVAAAPVISVATASWIANSHGCALDEGSVHQCIINGHDYGELLTTMGVVGWLMLVTIPAGAAACVVWLVVLLLHRAKWKRGAPAASFVRN